MEWKELRNFYEQDLQILNIAVFHVISKPGKKTLVNGRNFHGFVYTCKGAFLYQETDGRQITAEEGDLVYLPKEGKYIHIARGMEKGNPAESETIVVNFLLKDSSHREIHFGKNICKWKGLSGKKYEELFLQLFSLYEQGDFSFLLLKSLLYQLFYEIAKDSGSASGQGKSFALIKPALLWLETQAGDRVSVFELAEKCGISVNCFRRHFQICFGMPPKIYMEHKRMEKAKKFLGSGEYTVGETAELLGFESSSHFTRTFKRLTGALPKDYLS